MDAQLFQDHGLELSYNASFSAQWALFFLRIVQKSVLACLLRAVVVWLPLASVV